MTVASFDQTTGVILAGGKSKRFGSNKALALVDGQPIIAHAANVLSGLFSSRLLVTNAPELYEFLNWPITGDLVDDAGPLAGIQTALTKIDTPFAFVAACDMPQLNPTLIRYLCSLPGAWDVVLPWTANGPEPLHALYAKTALPIISENLDHGERKLQTVLAGLKVRQVTTNEILTVVPDLESFANINKPGDLREG